MAVAFVGGRGGDGLHSNRVFLFFWPQHHELELVHKEWAATLAAAERA
jgi:hypothetical protein